jgi:hypothetical protein
MSTTNENVFTIPRQADDLFPPIFAPDYESTGWDWKEADGKTVWAIRAHSRLMRTQVRRAAHVIMQINNPKGVNSKTLLFWLDRQPKACKPVDTRRPIQVTEAAFRKGVCTAQSTASGPRRKVRWDKLGVAEIPTVIPRHAPVGMSIPTSSPSRNHISDAHSHTHLLTASLSQRHLSPRRATCKLLLTFTGDSPCHIFTRRDSAKRAQAAASSLTFFYIWPPLTPLPTLPAPHSILCSRPHRKAQLSFTSQATPRLIVTSTFSSPHTSPH